MKIILERANERVEITGDDDLICDSVAYQHTFERQVKATLDKFYEPEQARQKQEE